MAEGSFAVRILGPEDEALLLATPEGVFDEAVEPALARQFLADPSSHLIAAIAEGTVIGFASALAYCHPDKPLELWVNEVGVIPSWHRRGVGTALFEEAKALAARLGAGSVWVLAEADDARANDFYRAIGGEASGAVMYSFAVDGKAG